MKTGELSPLLAENKPVDWWFAFKFNAATFPGDESQESNPGIFGGAPKDYKGEFCLSYAVASSASPTLQMGDGYIGGSLNDPLGATFDQLYNGACNYVVWNDQFYNDPLESQGAPWGHSKGFLAWDDAGAGFVVQVSTPSWPASGSKDHPRQTDGNTLGCINDDDVRVSQHFFALKLNADDVKIVLAGLANASVVTDPTKIQIVRNVGPADIQKLVNALGKESASTIPSMITLSSGVRFITKPSQLHVAPWQMVSAALGSLPLRVASWWADPKINSTDATTPINCWNAAMLGQPGPVQIATTGTWQGKSIGLEGGDGNQFNHAKLGVSMDAAQPLSIFGDMNQQGTLCGIEKEKVPCASSQNGRGGLFFVLQQKELYESLSVLLKGESAAVAGA
ncbi:MAG: hypothetical protein A2061_01510 [Gallionellales bacterium GWA2_59_43]|nr:MAG: hypothetical protein A2061_01510 [Gallionellales bacterium GWA2_59_43]